MELQLNWENLKITKYYTRAITFFHKSSSDGKIVRSEEKSHYKNSKKDFWCFQKSRRG